MNSLEDRGRAVEPGNWKMLLRIAAVAGTLIAGPIAWYGIAPIFFLLLQILLGLGQTCVTILRIG